MHCWGWTMRADSIFACCSHDNSKAEGPPGSSCRGGNGSTLFPSTGHQFTRHLHHLKPPHLHGGHVLKQTAGGKEEDQRSWVWNSGGRVGAAAEGKTETVCKCWPGRQFISEREGCAALALSGAAGIRAEGLSAADKLWQNLFASSSYNPAEGEPWQKRRVEFFLLILYLYLLFLCMTAVVGLLCSWSDPSEDNWRVWVAKN